MIFDSTNPIIEYLLSRVQSYFDYWNNEISLCNYALQVNGVLKDQVDYYINGDDRMQNLILARGNEIIDRVTLSNNLTITTPLASNQESTAIMKVFLKNGMISVVFFLGILCV